MFIIKWLQNRKWLTVGMKILAGVAVASNIFIGGLLYFNLKSSVKVENTVNEVLEIREKLSSNLRAALVKLQNQFLSMPDFFHINPYNKIVETIDKEFKVVSTNTLKGRESYADIFDRKERRDLAKGEFVVKVHNEELTVSSGILDDAGNFTESVEVMAVRSENRAVSENIESDAGNIKSDVGNIESDVEKIKAVIADISQESGSVNAIKQKIAELGSIVADSAMEAEKTRNEILDHVEQISSMEHKLYEIRTYQRKLTIFMGIGAVLANMLVLFILVKLIVERPLYYLTHTIDEIRAGKNPDIRWGHRKDQIGVLSGAILNFKDALSKIREENERKAKESIIIDEIFAMINSIVQTLEKRAKEMVNCADTLYTLAATTGNQSQSVHLRANDTAVNTDNVSQYTNHLKDAVQDINSQILNQKQLVNSIIEKNIESHSNIKQLNQSISDVNSIISVIREITDQTKLLALNAAIEAGRAGSSGQGFSVVAGEVKELSIKTQHATKDVMQKVAAIEKAGSLFVENLDDIDKRVNDLNAVTANIVNAVNEQKQAADKIAELAGQTSNNTKDVSMSIEEVTNAAGETSNLSKQVHIYSDEIASQLTKLLHDTSEKINQLSRLSSDMREQAVAALAG